MRRNVQRYWRSFSIGFIVAFVAYLFIRWESDKVFTGVGIAVAGGILLIVIAEFARNRWLKDDDVVEVER